MSITDHFDLSIKDSFSELLNLTAAILGFVSFLSSNIPSHQSYPVAYMK